MVPPPARDEEQLHGAVSPRLALQQDETARDLAAVQEKQELEEAIERAQQEMQQLMQLQNAAALQQSDTGDVQAPNGTPLDRAISGRCSRVRNGRCGGGTKQHDAERRAISDHCSHDRNGGCGGGKRRWRGRHRTHHFGHDCSGR